MKNTLIRIRKSDESGFTLLEYCAGAAVIITVLYASFTTLGNNLGGFMDGIGEWASKKGGEISEQG